ncbi:MAG: ATP-dependent helicase, partial [Thiofilum sp.]
RTNGNGGAPSTNNPVRKRSDHGMRMPSTLTHDAPYAIGDWENQTDYMPTKTVNPDKKVVIRYKEKRRTLLK